MLTGSSESGSAVPSLPPRGEDARFDEQLAEPLWQDPLYLMMAALVSRETGVVEALTLSSAELADRVAAHELGRVMRFAPPDPPSAARLLRHMAAYVTICGGLNGEGLLAAARQQSQQLGLDYPGGPGELAAAVCTALPAPDQGAVAVTPDIVGEAVLLAAWDTLSTEAQAAVLGRACQQRPAVVPSVVIRTAQDFCPHGRAAPLAWLEILPRQQNSWVNYRLFAS